MGTYEYRDPKEVLEQKWRWCVKCGQNFTQYEMDFLEGQVAPTVGETLTGQTSGKTATVVSVELMNGSYAAHTARGTVVLSSPTGDFTDNELVNGSTSGTGKLRCRTYLERRYGIPYPESSLSTWKGKEYCPFHARALRHTQWDEQKIEVKELT